MQILLHTCCGPCSAYPIQALHDSGHSLISYFYNPNIHPYKEFVRRRDTLKSFAETLDIPVVIDERYTLEEFLEAALLAKEDRCRKCYEMRLQQTAYYAKQHQMDAFTTTLLVSPYQKHDLIREVGEAIGLAVGVPFFYMDFRTGWQQGVAKSKELDLYRQPYCGCIFSERDRYQKSSRKRGS